MNPKGVVVAVSLLTLVSSFVIAVPCRAEQTWGHVRGRFVWDGEVPSPRSLNVTKDVAELGQTIPDDSLLVNPDNRGIANVAVYLLPVKRGETIAVHPSYADSARKEVVLAIDGSRFAPHAAVIRTSQTLILKNKDNVGHVPNIATLRNAAVKTYLRPGDRASVTLSHAERLPIMASGCIHPWLRGYLLVTDHPYATFTDANGEFEIACLPTGQCNLRVWHERAGLIKSATIDGQSMTWDKGRWTVHVQPGTYDMGEIRVTSELFQRP